MNHYVPLSLTNRKSSVHLHDLYSPRTALRTFTPRWDQLVICWLPTFYFWGILLGISHKRANQEMLHATEHPHALGMSAAVYSSLSQCDQLPRLTVTTRPLHPNSSRCRDLMLQLLECHSFIHSQALIVQDGPLASLSGFLDHTYKDTR
jgi:hypothetical protein